MKTRTLVFAICVVLLALSLSTPSTQGSACNATTKKKCHDEAELVIRYCMIVNGAEAWSYCTDRGADYEDKCLGELGCPIGPSGLPQ